MKFVVNATFDTQKVFDRFREHIEDQISKRKIIANHINANILMSEHRIDVKSINGTGNVFFPIVTFERMDGILDIDPHASEYNHIILSFKFDDPKYAALARDIMCEQLVGLEEFIGKENGECSIVVSDGAHEDIVGKENLTPVDHGCTLIIGAETNMIAKLDFIPEKYLNLK